MSNTEADLLGAWGLGFAVSPGRGRVVRGSAGSPWRGLRYLVCATLVIAVTCRVTGAEIHTWHHRTTGESYHGTLIGAVDGKLRIRKEGSETVTEVDAGELSLADLHYAYGQLQVIAARKTPPPVVAPKPDISKPPGSCLVELKCWKQLTPAEEERLKGLLRKQLEAYSPFPPDTETIVRLDICSEHQSVGSFRLGSHAFLMLDSKAVCFIRIVRRARRRETTLHAENLELTSVELLGGPPRKPAAPITREQLADMLLAEMIKKIQQWQMPANVLGPPEK